MALVVGRASSIAWNLGPQVDTPVLTEVPHRQPGLGVDGQQIAVRSAVEEPLVVPVLVGPVGQPARAVTGCVDGMLRRANYIRVMDPPDLAGACIDRRRESEGCDDIDGPADHQRRDPHVEDA